MIDLEPRRLYQGQLLTEAEVEERRRYARERGKSIRRGDWSPHRAAKPLRDPTDTQVAWAAGFFQGEGYVRNDRRGVTVTQCEIEPLLPLLEMFGGSIRLAGRRTQGQSEVWVWSCCGENGRRFARLVAPWLVGQKREQMHERLGES